MECKLILIIVTLDFFAPYKYSYLLTYLLTYLIGSCIIAFDWSVTMNDIERCMAAILHYNTDIGSFGNQITKYVSGCR